MNDDSEPTRPSQPTPSEASLPRQHSGRWVLAVIGAPVALTAGWFALGMPGMDHTATQHDMATMGAQGMSALGQLSPAEFASLDPAALVLNVHVPYEGEIADTDGFVDYRTIAESPDLPSDRDTPIALYCMSGRMSTIAGDTLLAAGYTNVVHLTGGMKAWADSGRELTTGP